MALQFHDVLHGLWVGRVTGTASLEAKLIQRLIEMREEVLYQILLDLRNSCDEIDRERCMEILLVYGIGPHMESILG